MANESSASGCIYFEARSMTDLDRLVSLFSETMRQSRDMYYATEVQEPFKEDCVDIMYGDDGAVTYSFVSPFWGVGRWSYKTNAENLASWFVGAIAAKAKSDPELLNEEIRLRGVPWSICISCECDLEEGCQVLSSFEAEIAHPAGTAIKGLKTSFSSFKDYDYTAKNLYDIAGDDRAWDLSPEFVETALEFADARDVLDWMTEEFPPAELQAAREELSKHLINTCPDIDAGCPYIDELWDPSEQEQLRDAAYEWMSLYQ